MNKMEKIFVDWTLICVMLLPPTVVFSSSEDLAQPKAANSTQEIDPASVKFEYRPPALGAPRGRIGAGTRGGEKLQALSPTHIGLTSSPQTRLYWYIAPGINNKLRFRLTDFDDPLPTLEAVLDAKPDGGIHYLDLAKYGVRLEPDRVYRWVVMLEPTPRQRWSRISSGGSIQLVRREPFTQSKSVGKRFLAAAEEGYWYDALDLVSHLTEGKSSPSGWHLQRATLLEQGRLDDAAEFERKQSEKVH